MKSVKFNPLTSLVMAAALAIGLAGCGGGSDTVPEPPPPTALETATSNYDMAKAAHDALTDASTPEARVAAAEALSMAAADLAAATAADSSSTASDLAAAQMKASEAASALSMAQAAKKAADEMAAADAELAGLRTDYSDAVAAYDALGEDASNADRLTAARAIHAAAVALRDELRSRNAPVDDVEMAEGYVTMAQSKVDAANMAVQDEMTADARRTAQLGMITDAIAAAQTAVGMVDNASTDAEVEAAEAAVSNARAKIAEAADVADDVKETHTARVDTLEMSLTTAKASRQMMLDASQELAGQRKAISDAIAAAKAAVEMVMDDSADAVVDAATQAIANARVAIAGASDVPDEEKAANTGTVNEIMDQLETAKASRMTAMEEARKEAEAENAANAATAAKLYKGVAAQNGASATTAAGTPLSAGERAAAYNDAGVPSGSTPTALIDTRIMVGIGADTPVALTEDKKAMVAANHGWTGKRYTAEPDDDGMYEAMVYSNVGEPTMGKKFGGAAANDEFEYALTDGMLTIDTTSDTAIQMRVASSMFDQSAGVKTFKLPENDKAVMISGSYHGVSGTYSCTPAGDTICASRVAANDGFQLGTVASATDSTFTAGATGWTFKPGDPNARVTSMPDANYASYGWWIHKSEDGSEFTASAFMDIKGAVGAAAALDSLEGTATYMGGAAGKYALSSSTGGTNDAGHFTARAMLEADFSDNSITGTIDNFMGADGMSRDWSVELKEAAVAATGGITRTGTDQTDNDTVWTIDGTAAAASGAWSGTLYDNGDDGVPKVGTGTFDSTYGTAGKIVGGFGVNKQ